MPQVKHTINDIINDAVAEAVAKILPAVQRQVAALVSEEMERGLTLRGARRARPVRRVRSRPQEMTKWVADRRARRVPNFVIELTGGLDTKKRIVAKFGPGVVFEKGKPLPKAKAA
jgi:hypothetical protein